MMAAVCGAAEAEKDATVDTQYTHKDIACGGRKSKDAKSLLGNCNITQERSTIPTKMGSLVNFDLKSGLQVYYV